MRMPKVEQAGVSVAAFIGLLSSDSCAYESQDTKIHLGEGGLGYKHRTTHDINACRRGVGQNAYEKSCRRSAKM